MLKAVFTILTSCACCSGNAQVLIAIVFGDKLNTDKLEFGLTVSPAFTKIDGFTGSYRPALDLGLYFNIKISDNFFLHPEAIPKSAFGAKNIDRYYTGMPDIDTMFAGGSIQRKIKAISLPLLVRYRIKKLLFAVAGPQINWLLQSKDIFKQQRGDNTLYYNAKINDQFTSFELGVAGGLEYKIKKDKGMGIGLRYVYGLTDVMKNTAGGQHNTAWMINVSIPVGGTPKTKKTT